MQHLHLVGHSVGAAVAATLASSSDLDVRSLTMIAPAGLGPRINGDFVDGFLASQDEAALKVWLGLLVHKLDMLPGALLRATFAARDGTSMVANQKKLAGGLFSGNTQLFSIRADLEKFDRPSRVIVGTDDSIIPASHADAVPAHVAINRLPHVGHLPQLEAAALTARLVAETVRSAG
jgi:pyruvate dehydrogenase E2 component (dihydrolipoamide acetyltransferase)